MRKQHHTSWHDRRSTLPGILCAVLGCTLTASPIVATFQTG